MNELIDDIISFFYHDLFNPELAQTNMVHKIILSAIIIFLAFWFYRFLKFMMKRFITNMKVKTVLIASVRNIIAMIAFLLVLTTWLNVKNSVLIVVIAFAALSVFSIRNLSNNLVA